MLRIIVLVALSLVPFCAFAEGESFVVPDDYADIQEAIEAAYNDESISRVDIKPGTYELSETVLLYSGVGVKGLDTEHTIIKAKGSSDIEVLFLVNNTASNIKVQNLSFHDADVAFRMENGTGSGLELTNNIFFLGKEGIAIDIRDESVPIIENNVFYANNYAISGSDLALTYTHNIKHNIFYGNEYVATSTIVDASFSYNCFYDNSNGIETTDANSIYEDPLFVLVDADEEEYDFHLKAGSPCIDAGDETNNVKDVLNDSRLDIGAYGGPDTQREPAPVKFKTDISTVDNLNYSITFTWSPNLAYEVDNDKGGYLLYFGDKSNNYEDYVSGSQSSPIDVSDAQLSGSVLSITKDGFQVASAATDSPTIESVEPFNQRLVVKWSSVDNATGYYINYTPSGGNPLTIDAEDVTSYSLENLTNGVSYTITVSSYSQPSLFFYLKSYEGLSGNKNESVWAEEFERKISIGEQLTSAPSISVTATPDEILAYPTLSGEGCFIATATYGSYDAQQVQVFRTFRDKILIPTYLGSTFVKYYYQYGPIAASWLNVHGYFKPLVQAILFPYLILAKVCLWLGLFKASLLLLLLVFISALLPIVVWRKRQAYAF